MLEGAKDIPLFRLYILELQPRKVDVLLRKGWNIMAESMFLIQKIKYC